MKKITFLIILLAIGAGLTISAQIIPNGDFENWEQGDFGFEVPVGWESLGNSFGTQDAFKVAGHSGDYAVELKPFLFSGGTEMFATFMSSPTFPVNQRYAALKGYLKGLAVGNDTLSILVTFVKDGSVVGFGFKEVSQELSDFTPFNIPVSYPTAGIPDSAFVLITISDFEGNAHEGTAYTFDDLAFEGVAGINDLSAVFGQVENAYPNPATSTITIPFELKNADQLQLTVFDVQGKMVRSINPKNYNVGLNEISLNLEGLNQGLYFYNLIPSDGKGISKTFIVK